MAEQWYVGTKTGINGSFTTASADAILTVDFMHGRVWQTDPYAAASGSVTYRPSEWATTAPAVNQLIIVYCRSTACGLVGTITDVSIDYGITANEDIGVITFEGALSAVGRTQLTDKVLAQKNTLAQAQDVLNEVAVRDYTLGSAGSTLSGQTYSGNALDLLNQQIVTEIGRIAQIYSDNTLTPFQKEPAVVVIGRNYVNRLDTNQFDFSDVSTDWSADVWRYTDIEFTSAAETYATEVTITPQGLATQTATSGSAPYIGLTQSSLDYTTAQALNHAQYLLNNFNSATAVPHAITTSWTAQGAISALAQQYLIEQGLINRTTFLAAGNTRTPIGKPLVLKFRGTTYNMIVEGYRVSATPTDTVVTYYISPQDNNAYLVLDDVTYGKLDNNKLGF